MSEKSDIDTNSDFDVSVELDNSEPHATMTKTDSVTAVLAVQKLVTQNQSSTKFKHLSRSCINNFPKELLGTGSDGGLMLDKNGTIKHVPY